MPLEPSDTLVAFAAQSNGLGYLNNGPAPYLPTARVQIAVDSDGDGRVDTFNYMLPGVNTGTATNPLAWGPEVTFANDWLASHPTGTLYIAKVAKGETALAQNSGLDWSPTSAGELFDRGTQATDFLRLTLGADHLDAVFLMLGEQDATKESWAQAYAENLRTFVAAIRASWMHDADGYVGLGRISDSEALPFNAEVRFAQWLVDQEDDHLESFKTIGYAMQPDGVHYAPDGQVALGEAFYDSWAI